MRLDMHHDESDVTLNVCLGRNFTGSGLTVCGLYGNKDYRRAKHVYMHRPGRAVLHLGRQRHGADDLLSGERVNFLLWSTSSSWRATKEYQQLWADHPHEEKPDLIFFL
mmetsp:Transcript_4682/g.6465  ORF Transcript_4682/g.6465 Transcript_4682/m.6465 type:complete len:109 (-) Transcript_4682:10-336(-)